MKKGVDYTGISITFYCHDGKGNYVLSKRGENCRDERGTWEPGAGGLELHDTVEGTLKKEIKEEFGTDVLDFEFLGYRDAHRMHEGVKTHWVALDFKVLVDPDKVHNAEPHKFDEVAWFRLDALPAPLHSQLPIALEKYKDRL